MKIVPEKPHTLYERAFKHTPSIAARITYFYIQSAGHFKCGRDYATKREGYESFLLIYTVGGKGYANYRNRHYELGRGSVLLINCYDFQEYYTDRDELWEIKWVHFNGGKSEEYFNLIYENFGPVMLLPQDNCMEQYLDTVLELMENGDIRFEAKSSCIIVQMLTELILGAGIKHGLKSDRNMESPIEAALDFIERNYTSPLSLDAIAGASCMSKYHFIRTFKRITGFSPYEYLIKYRISAAKKLLMDTRQTVEEIAVNVGFSNASGFIKTFSKLEGITPLKYRSLWTV